MTIRLTSVEAFEKVLEKLKQDPLYSEEVNGPFYKYCVEIIKDGLLAGEDEWYLDVKWLPDNRSIRGVAMEIRHFSRSEITTDEEYLKEKVND